VRKAKLTKYGGREGFAAFLRHTVRGQRSAELQPVWSAECLKWSIVNQFGVLEFDSYFHRNA
jgi:hypothetical protein